MFTITANDKHAAMAGAALYVIGLDTVFAGLGLPSAVHWAAAGAATAISISGYEAKVRALVAGYAGGLALAVTAQYLPVPRLLSM